MSSKRSRAAFESDSTPPQHAPYALFGTPLPAFDPEARDDGSYVPIWKQEVTDDRGRKRLHGAFTGGYSAGYFNTVGSKEGWTPQTFVSSRTNRAKKGEAKQGMRPEDFMDEEDLAEQREAQQLETQGGFAGLGAAGAASASKGMFSDLFKTTGETMGVKLLQRMGWRQGQGVGPRVRRRAQGDKSGEMHLFAPENTRMIGFSRKIDRKGLGFAGEESLGGRKGADEDEESDTDARILNRSKVLAKPKKVKKSSFGVGVLNDTGSDDEDPYAIGPAINYSRIIGGDKKKRKGGLVASTTVQRPTVQPKKFSPATRQRTTPGSSLAGFRRCHDGRLPLDGFVLSIDPLVILTDSKYPPPTVPVGWKSSRRATKFDAEARTFTSTAEAARASALDPKARAAMLGEAALPGKSVFDFLSPAARDKLASASGRSDLPQARGEGAPAGFESNRSNESPTKTLWDLVPPLDAATAAAALHRGRTGWLPYAEDPDKRDRYTAFLRLRAGQSYDAPSLPARPAGWSTDDWAKELREFAQAAEVFKPISGLMATRFTSSTSAPKLASDAPDPTPKVAERPLDPAEEAAKAGMFGAMTRSSAPFYPTRLLCKRFGVKPPANTGVEPNEGGGEGGGAADLVSQASLDRMMLHAQFQLPRFAKGATEGGSVEEGVAGGNERAHVDIEMNEALEGKKASAEVFKSVFEED